MNQKAVQKYLLQHAEPEASSVLNLIDQTQLHIERCLVIPAYAESPSFVQRLISAWPDDEHLLVILVINKPTSCSETERGNAHRCLEEVQELLPMVEAEHGHLSWRKSPDCKILFLLVDRCSEQGIPNDQGVGLARKIGCDICLQLFAKGQIKTQWMRTTDADAHLPADYFSPNLDDCSAGYYSHEYLQAEPALYQATKIYDLRNHDYRSQLAAAGSEYAFNPTGSLLMLDFPSYAQVRGFPKRAGGEDFYLLNKMQKMQGVSKVLSAPIELECRLSERVPFGTGPAVSKLLQCDHPEEEKIFYQAKGFEIFSEGLTCLRCTDPAQWMSKDDIPNEFKEALKELNIEAAIQHLSPLFEKDKINNPDSLRNYRYHLDLWFDAFRSLKVIHFLRDNYFPAISYQDWLRDQSD